MQPDTKYTLVDGARIAYQVFGVEAPTLVMMAGSFSHTDGEWEDPPVAEFLTRLGAFTRVVRYDHLGMSNSDAFPAKLDPARAYESELDAVLAACGAGPVVLLATLDAGPAAIRYAAEHEGRVSKLVLLNTLARFLQGDGYPYGFTPEEVQALLRLYDAGWGAITPVLLQANVPSRAADAAFAAWYAKLARMIGTPSTIAATITRAVGMDARASLSRIACPTLVMHRTAFKWIPIEHGRYLAEHIPGARLVELPGADGPPYYESADLVLDSLRAFIVGEDATSRLARRELLTVLCVGVAGATERDPVTAEVNATGGHLVRFAGDGILATFDDPARALACATQLRGALARVGVAIRAGLHTGQVNVGADDVDGLAVDIAAGAMAAGGDGDIVVSRTVHELLLGSSFRFASLGPRALPGIEGEWELFQAQP